MSFELKDICKSFPGEGPGREVKVLENINHRIKDGRFVSIIGPSGCGKTTLLRIMAGLERATSGSVVLEGRDITNPSGQIGLVFQEYALFPWRTTISNIEMGLEIKKAPKEERRQAALEYIRAFGLEGFENNYPRELSGGMQQRVAIARTLIMHPKVVLMDEPFGSLDSQTRQVMQEFLLEIWEDRQETIVFVTHNVNEAVFLSDEILVLGRRPGRVIKHLELNGPRPRDRSSKEVNNLRREIFDLLREQQGPLNNN